MKNLIIMYIFAIVALSSCNNSNGKSDKSFEPDSTMSVKSALLADYQLVRPINYDKGAADAYNQPIRDGQWYLICKATDYFLLPVNTDGGMGPNFIENVIKYKHMAKSDTFVPVGVNWNHINDGLKEINTVEIICFRPMYSIRPSIGMNGGMTVIAEKK